MNRAINIVLLLLLAGTLNAQEERVLSHVNFIIRVKQFHPLFLTNEIQDEMNQNRINSARGRFDPKLKFNRNNKSFEGEEYYNLLNAGLEIPTWFGGAIGGGFNQNEGIYLNPENKNPVGGLVYGYISQPLLKGLVWDKRRSELKKAENYAQLNEAEQIFMANQLLFNASETYWNWFESYYAMKALEINLKLALDRLEAIKQKVLFGDRPAVDSVEATIQKDLREIAYQKALLKEKNNKQALSQFLWTVDKIPVDVSLNTVPQNLSNTFLDAKSTTAIVAQIPIDHPINIQNAAKVQLINIERKMAIENLKPELDVIYKPLNKSTGNFIENYSVNNYNLGINFSVPLFFRKGRNDLKLAKRSLEQNSLNYQQKQNNLRIKLIQTNNKITTETGLVAQYDELVKQYLIIVEAERALLNEGESSLFLLNRRESNLISSQLKYYQSLSKCLILKANLSQLLAQER